MTGPGPLDDWADWNAATRPIRPAHPSRPAQQRDGPIRSSGTSTVPPLPGRQTPPLPTARGAGTYAEPFPARTPTAPLPRLPRSPRRRRTWVRIVRYALLAALLAALVFGAFAAQRIYAFGQAISPQGPLSTQTGYMTGSQRINLLVLGYGGAGHDGAYLTDSELVISLIPATGSTTLISVPRDLWVQVPPDSGQYAKINTAYQYGLYNGYNGLPAGRLAGAALAARKVSDVIGLPITYWMTMNFQGFRKLVDALGGVTITVPTAFTAKYPRNDDPSIDASWETIHFDTGSQHMDGERAIEYARARYVLDPPSEGTDFARSARQQILVRAILSRARQVSAWPRLAGAADALQGAIYTNLSLADLALLGEKANLTHAQRVGLTNQNVLVDAQSADGQAILLPANGDWSAIPQYVASQLKP